MKQINEFVQVYLKIILKLLKNFINNKFILTKKISLPKQILFIPIRWMR